MNQNNSDLLLLRQRIWQFLVTFAKKLGDFSPKKAGYAAPGLSPDISSDTSGRDWMYRRRDSATDSNHDRRGGGDDTHVKTREILPTGVHADKKSALAFL